MDEIYLVVGKDSCGRDRVYGEHCSFDVAETMAKEEAAKYVRSRPDTGPLSQWTFETQS